MKSHIIPVFIFWVIAIKIEAQIKNPFKLNIGDTAPSLKVSKWLKGKPFKTFEKNKVYVVEFWATWCRPCIIAMPHLSSLSSKYEGKVIILGIDVYEKETTSLNKISAFVDGMGDRMDYNVAVEDSNFMAINWLDASGTKGIPNTFVIDGSGRLAWIGEPQELDEVLAKILNGTWNINEVVGKRNFDNYLEELDNLANEKLNTYAGDWYKHDYFGKPDSALLLIEDIVTKEPKLKYAPLIASHTFSCLLKTNPYKAYSYGKIVIETTTYTDPPYNLIIGSIDELSDKFNLPKRIYDLCAEAHQLKIDRYWQTINIPNTYHKMAEWYMLSGNKSKAIEAQKKAIQFLKAEKNYSKSEMNKLEFCLREYENMQ